MIEYDENGIVHEYTTSYIRSVLKKDDGVYISARSLGDVNVQVIVEALGGGGNSTTAGGQLPDTTVGEVREKLLEKIDQYFEN